ncbi:hypothetical protein [uncultured Pseudoalteromonas sp.]|uniref:hypothetical protein n=1 Tax=uncultured Pseudoalteromonas sp. TaxID=114053 RepID=UPI0030F9C8D9
MKNRIVAIFSWVVVLWTSKVFLFSLPYKFSGHPDTQHIFGTIGAWMQDTISPSLGQWFISNGAIAVGSFELLASLLLLSPIVFWALKKFNVVNKVPSRALIHTLGGLLSAGVMAGAIFFHLVTPLGIEVLHNGVSDGGSLFYAAVSIFVLGIISAFVNSKILCEQCKNISQ